VKCDVKIREEREKSWVEGKKGERTSGLRRGKSSELTPSIIQRRLTDPFRTYESPDADVDLWKLLMNIRYRRPSLGDDLSGEG